MRALTGGCSSIIIAATRSRAPSAPTVAAVISAIASEGPHQAGERNGDGRQAEPNQALHGAGELDGADDSWDSQDEWRR